jgi:hypothetical protein
MLPRLHSLLLQGSWLLVHGNCRQATALSQQQAWPELSFDYACHLGLAGEQ